MKKQGKHHTPKEKIAIAKGRLLEQVPPCDKRELRLGRTAVLIFAANDRINQILIEHLDPAAWRAKPPGKARTIAAIFTHMHNIRPKWVRLTSRNLKVPREL